MRFRHPLDRCELPLSRGRARHRGRDSTPARIVGKALAKELLFTGRVVKADEAVRIGLANRAVSPAELGGVVDDMARAIAAAPPLAIQLVKRCIDRGVETDLASGIKIEREAIEQALAGEEWKQGVAAFVAGAAEKK
ncbi:MAG: enoyl-CoA hydratase-related protein [Pseudomonadota bacterium]